VTAPPSSPRDAYSPQSRTALVLTGSGTAGAYHAGVLRAFQEAGVKIDLVAGTGMGVASALFAAIDGGTRLWAEDGLWRSSSASRYYRVRAALRTAAWALAASLSVVLLPLLALVAGLLVYPTGFLLRLAGVSSAGWVSRAYTTLVETAFDPGYLPAVLPRAFLISLVLVVGTLGLVAIGALATGRGRRRDDAPVWWRIVGAPLSAAGTARAVSSGLWQLVGGAAGARRPGPVELSRAYTELLRENLGQPGFRELLLTAHDLDMRRDFVFAMLDDRHRRDFFRSSDGPGGDRRLAESFDLAGVSRDHLVDAALAGISLPVATEVQEIGFPPESYWCGEVHRAASRPGAVDRLLDELPVAGVEQVIVVSPFPELEGPHRLTVPRSDWRGRLGDFLAGADAAAMRSAVAVDRPFRCIFVVRPGYNPVGPLDVSGCYDQRSDRVVTLGELVDRGYEDAYRQFIDPVVGASGERLEVTGRRRGWGVSAPPDAPARPAAPDDTAPPGAPHERANL
jgi:Patatin-like phospholipase